jgi:hypothetical protein
MPHHDFELYSAQEPQLDFNNQHYMPSTYIVDPAFSASYEPVTMPALSELPPRPHDLQSYYDGIAQGVKPSFQYSPHGSPHSISHSFQDQPPILSASSESSASVSSSNTGSPSLNPQYNEPWNHMTHELGLSSGYEYNGMVVTDKAPGCVGESTKVPSKFESSFPIASPKTPVLPSPRIEGLQTPLFISPVTPASASTKWSASRTGTPPTRRGSLLSNEIRLNDLPDIPFAASYSYSCIVNSSSTHSARSPLNLVAPLESSCRFLSSGLSDDQSLEQATDHVNIDPGLIQPGPFGNPIQFGPQSPYAEILTPYFPVIEHPPSPTLSHISSHSQRPGSQQLKRGSRSPSYLHTQQFHPYSGYSGQRRQSNASIHSQHSGTSRKSASTLDFDDETREKGLCPLPECGRVFKDLKAHMLTHQNERPEKCPITTCEYHMKGFARKYDKNRHTLTHYKGTMVCGFCPGSGSAAEKSFNRADVFKRHLTSVHGVEQNPPNSRKKSPTGRKAYTGSAQSMAGTCSTCSVTFANAQEFYEHLDDCVLRVVQQADPSEAINQRLLTSVAEDKDVADTLDRNGLPNSVEYSVPNYDEEEEEEEEEEIDVDDHNDDTYGARRSRSGKGSVKTTKSH